MIEYSIVVLLVLVVIGGIVYYEGTLGSVLHQYGEVVANWESTIADLDAANLRVEQSDAAATEVVFAVTPLIEKTDWTTGNYIGRLDHLRQQESKRNELVDSLRKKLWDIPVVKDEIPAAIPFTLGTTHHFPGIASNNP